MSKSLMRSEVPAWLRRTAEQAASDAAGVLGIPAPALRWVDAPELAAGGWVNFHDDESIFCNRARLSQLSPSECRAVLFHETYHVWQFKKVRFRDPRQDEDAAESFAYRHTGTFIPGSPHPTGG